MEVLIRLAILKYSVRSVGLAGSDHMVDSVALVLVSSKSITFEQRLELDQAEINRNKGRWKLQPICFKTVELKEHSGRKSQTSIEDDISSN